MLVRSLSIQYRPLNDVLANPRNARTHSEKQIAQLSAGIARFGFTNPVLVDEGGMLIAGHARLQAALRLTLEQIPTITISGLSDHEKRALVIADNKLALNAGWDIELLAEELLDLSSPMLELDGFTGFETAEIDVLLADAEATKADPVDSVEAIDRSVPSIAKLGQLWTLGEHRILCGDALAEESYRVLLGDEKAEQGLTDPPFNVTINGHVSGLGTVRHNEFAMASGEMLPAQFSDFLRTALQRMADFSVEGAMLMAFMDWRHIETLLEAGRAVKLELKNLCVWDKVNGGMGSLYRSQHELIAVFKSGSAAHINNVELGRHGRYRTNVWRHPGANMFRKGRKQDLKTHPTVKPIAMIMDAIRDCSDRSGIVLDPFGGSGTTLLAAERTGRRGRLIELDPYYVDATIRRWEAMTGRTASLTFEPEAMGSAVHG